MEDGKIKVARRKKKDNGVLSGVRAQRVGRPQRVLSMRQWGLPRAPVHQKKMDARLGKE